MVIKRDACILNGVQRIQDSVHGVDMAWRRCWRLWRMNTRLAAAATHSCAVSRAVFIFFFVCLRACVWTVCLISANQALLYMHSHCAYLCHDSFCSRHGIFNDTVILSLVSLSMRFKWNDWHHNRLSRQIVNRGSIPASGSRCVSEQGTSC